MCTAISILSDRAGLTHMLDGYSRSRRLMVSTAAARSLDWFRLCASQYSASSLRVSFGSPTAARSSSIAFGHCSSLT
jgi:hypothetical protein